MSNYVPHYTKKKQILARKEAALRRLIVRGATEEKLLFAALDIREARIRVLRARRAMIPPKGDATVKFRQIDQQIREVVAIPLPQLLAEFGYVEDLETDSRNTPAGAPESRQ